MKIKPLPLLGNLKEYLKLDLKSPTLLIWIKSPSPYVKIGNPAGSLNATKTKMIIKFGGDKYMLHRIVYYLHYEINPEQCHVDHIDRNPLNNNPNNLRIATASQNQSNKMGKSIINSTSKYKGVSYFKETKSWKTTIQKEGKSFHGGYFKTEKDAAKKYNELAIEYFNEFAFLNDV
jgi:hypothetical protein